MRANENSEINLTAGFLGSFCRFSPHSAYKIRVPYRQFCSSTPDLNRKWDIFDIRFRAAVFTYPRRRSARRQRSRRDIAAAAPSVRRTFIILRGVIIIIIIQYVNKIIVSIIFIFTFSLQF